MKHKYPDDGGLKEPVRDFRDGFDGFAMIREHFGIQRIEPDPLSRGDKFKITRWGNFYYRADNTRQEAGHVRLFSKGPGTGTGWCLYSYARQAPTPEWAMHRRWNFGLFCVHHVEPDKKATDPEGWHVTWAKLQFSKSYRGFTITWQLADTFKCKKEPRRKKPRKSGIGLKGFFS